MFFSKWGLLSGLINPIICKILDKWIRWVCLGAFFAVVIFSLPVHLKRGSANAQSGGVVTVYPSAIQTPGSGQGGEAVSSPSNTEHGSTTSSRMIHNSNASDSQTKTAVWSAFQNVSGLKSRVTLKFDWSFDASVDAQIPDSTGYGRAYARLDVNYSTNNGGSWSPAMVPRDLDVTVFGEEGWGDTTSRSGSESINLPNPSSIDITQIRLTDSILAQVETSAPAPTGNYASARNTVRVWNISLEVEIADTTAPTVTSFSPAAGATNVNTNANVTVTFSEAMNASTINTETIELRNPSNALVPAAVNYNASTFTATLDPTVSLAGGTTYTARVRGGSTDPRVKDAAGNALAVDKTWTFTTQSINAAAFISQSVPATMTAGESYTVTVSMLNQGSTTWTPGQAYRLGSQNPTDNGTWGLGRVNLSEGNSVSPGATATFSFVVTAPSSPGSYNFQWQMVQDGVEWFGATTPNIAVQVVPRNDSATFISQTVPSVMVAGEAYSVSITFQNTGNTTWTAANQYRLGSQNPVNNGTWREGRVYLEAGELVPPGALKTFSFQVVAPSTTGSYNFQWQMLRELVNWFGPASTNLVIAVNAAVDQAQFVSQSVPSVMIPQNSYSVSVTMKNTGNTTWDSNYRLGSDNPVNNLNWGVNRVYLASGETILPGGSKTFTFTVTAPASPISYALFQWRMLREGIHRFGDYSPAVVVGLSPNLNMALVDPINRIGLPEEDLLSRNYNWSLPLLSLPGRAGLDLGLALSLNSLVYTKAGSVIYFDPDQGNPAPGFRIGFPEIRSPFFNTEASAPSYLLTMPSGRRVELRQINTNVYEAVDSSYMLLTYDPINSVFILYTTDGTQCRFVDVTGSGDYKCVQIKDRNGNFITVVYGGLAEIRTVTDTLGRAINFNYDEFNHLLSITQNWGGQTHTWATFAYGTKTIQTNFQGLTLNGTTNGTQESVLMRVGLADGSIYSFEYNTYAQVKKIRRYAPNDSNSNPANFPSGYFERAYTTYGLPDNASSAQTDCPRITSRTDWAYDWNNSNTVTSTYLPDSSFASGEVTFPDGTRYKEFFATTGWQRGLTTQTENWASGVKKKWTELQWTQDNTSVAYPLNPRVTETNVHDDAGNRRRTRVDYNINFGLPSDVYKYDANATTVLRHSHTDYNLSAVYTDRRIIGLPSAQFLKDGNDTLFSKVTYDYDQPANPYLEHQGPPVQHDTANYGAGFVQGRGNLNRKLRWDVNAPNNESLASEYETGYNTSGSVIFTRDPLDHQSSINYGDSFSDLQNRNTYAYPTTVTDPDGLPSYFQYNYDFGAVTRTQDPKGAAVTRTYDGVGRIERITNMVNGAYTRYAYLPDQHFLHSYTTVNDFSESQQITGFDGHDRVRVTVSDHPTSVGQYKAQFNSYDVMGRLVGQTNPTEIDSLWQPAGDDAAAGWVGTTQAYDWQGRPTVSTNQDETTKEISYGGCGCAGGQVVVTRDEMGRRQKMTYDILGRLKTTQSLFIQPKNEPLNGDGDVYSMTTNTYNVRDQITNISHRAGLSGPEQNTVMNYDGHGRLSTRKYPIESAPTSYVYNADDTLQMMTDARGGTTTYTYNNRHLLTIIVYGSAPGVAHLDPVSFDYDAAGNRLWMDDGPGRVDYNYDMQSRLQSETREISGVGSYTLAYEYNLAGQVKSVTDPTGSSFSYVFNNAGQVTGVTGAGPASAPQYATNIQYRAWGGIKQMDYYNGVSMNRTFTDRMLASRYELNNVWDGVTYPAGARTMGYNFQNHPDGRLRFAGDLLNNKFDRSYSFDHIGRLQAASTAKGARGEPVGPGDEYQMPYSQTFSYDEFGNATSRNGYFWQLPQSDSAIYNNDRRQGWSYDNSGNVVDDATTGTHTYDCANRQVKFVSKATVGGFATGFPEEPAVEIEMGYDGDGSSVKRIETRREEVFNQPQPPPTGISTVVTTTYYLRSSVLGMAVISEIGNDGLKKVGYVYDPAGERLAKQSLWVGGSSLEWHHFPGGTGSWIVSRLEAACSTCGSARSAARAEMDPLGADVGTEHPPTPQYEYYDREKPLYEDGGNPVNYSFGCAWGGMPFSCSSSRKFLGETGPGFGTPPTFPKRLPSISWGSLGDLLLSKLPSSGIVNVDPRTPGFGGGFGFLPAQNPTQLPLPISRRQIDQLIIDANAKPTNSDCGNYVDLLVNVVETLRRSPNRSWKTRTYVLGAVMLLDGRARSKRLGHQGFDSFKKELWDGGQNDALYQHISAHAGATIIGNRLIRPIWDDRTGGNLAITGTQLTTYALQYDEHQRDDPALQGRRGESEAEIRDDHAGRLVGGQMLIGLSGKMGSEQLRNVLFGILCDR